MPASRTMPSLCSRHRFSGRLQVAITTRLLSRLLFSCGSSTRYVSTWKEPSVGPRQREGKKVAVFLIHPHEVIRRSAEALMTREITARGAQGVAGDTILEVDEDTEAAAQQLDEQGFDAVVNFHPGGQREEDQLQT